MLLLALLRRALALTGWRPDRSIALVGIGVLLTAVADMSYLDAVAHGTLEAPAWASSRRPASAPVTALAAWQSRRTARPVRSRRPAAAGAAARRDDRRARALVRRPLQPRQRPGATPGIRDPARRGCAALADARRALRLLGTSRGEATTDVLTGLRNRRALAQGHRRVRGRRLSTAPAPAAAFDLNGFKAYNDCYGHPAGDALLRRLGHALARAVDGLGDAYRMGGDEFCVLAAAPEDQHADSRRSTRAALSEHGDGFEITAALGTATIEAPDSNQADALRDADRPMYAEKNGLRGSAGGRARRRRCAC